MRPKTIGLVALITLLTATVLTPFPLKLPAPLKVLQPLAQTPDTRKVEADRLLQQATEQYQTSQFEAAKQSWQQALTIYREIKNRQGEGVALGNLGGAYFALGDFTRAIEYQQQDLAIAREIKYRQSEGVALNNLGSALFKSGKLALAERALIDGIKVWESLRAGLASNEPNKVSIFEVQAPTYRLLQQVLIAQNKTDAALEIAERGRARAFVELLARRLDANPMAPRATTPPTLSQIQQIAKDQNATLVEYSIIYDDDFKVQGKQQTHESKLYIWVVKPTGAVAFRRVDLTPLWQKQGQAQGTDPTPLQDLVHSLLKSSPRRWSKPLKQLHQLLIQPIAKDLPTDPNAHIIFIPQQSLFLVPFPALQEQDGKYLIEKHTILTAPSIQVLAQIHQQRQQLPRTGQDNAVVVGIPRKAVVVGNPTMPKVAPEPGEPPEQLESLPSAVEEAQAIAQLLHSQAITGNQATKVAIVRQLPQARIIHLATHGKADDVRGLGSWIALAPSSTDNGLLTASEILGLKLKAELVVLSACETGRGRITGDGVIGLSRSLISAGTPSVIVSLWSVPDAPTASLMTEFYQNLQRHPDKAQALRLAMQKTMKQHPEPINWAAFTLIGSAQY
jgi:CHAT domain-containing protein